MIYLKSYYCQLLWHITYLQHSIIETCCSFLEQVKNSKLKTCNSLRNDIEPKILYHISDSKLYDFEII